MPKCTVLTGWARKSKLTTTPKLPPPPRSAQKRSGCSCLRRGQQLAIGGDDPCADQVVDREAVPAHHPADTAAQGETADADVGACRRQ